MLLKEGRTKMRWSKTALFLLVFTFLPLLPFSAHALEVKFCVPSCPPEGAPIPVGTTVLTAPTDFGAPRPRESANGITTTVIDLFGEIVGPFTITATVTADQSSTIQQIIFNPTTIATDFASGCTTDDTNPCKLQIIASASQTAGDFPDSRPAGGYPAGVFKSGWFTGPQDPNAGDTISLTGVTSSLSESGSRAVINVTPGSGAGDRPVSLPSSCTGEETCKFIASDVNFGFYDTIEETVQHTCDTDAPCGTEMITTLNVEIKTAGNTLDLPAGARKATTAAALVKAQGSSLHPFTVATLAVGSKSFAVIGNFTLGADVPLFDPVGEETYLGVANLAMLIPKDMFHRHNRGALFTFLGTVKDLDVAASFVRDFKNPKKWWYAFGVDGVRLTGLHDVLETELDLAVGKNKGSGRVTPIFLGGD
jgi:hypothetical protein